MSVAATAVSESALIRRINRKLAYEGQMGQRLRKARVYVDRHSGREYEDHNLGRYFIIDIACNLILATHCDLEGLGRELQVLDANEGLEGSDV